MNRPAPIALAALLAMALLLCLAGPGIAQTPSYGPKVPEPTKVGIAYGSHERNVMDIWLAQGEGPRPVVVYFHSGGWYEGSKERLRREINAQQLLDAGISIVAVNYRLIPKNPTSPDKIDISLPPPVDAPLSDARRAVQFVRHNAKDWNIDPARLGVTGGSAGGCTSLWLAFHDDMADADSDDPVHRQSTRVSCAAVGWAQTTLDPVQGRAWIADLNYGAHAFGLASVDDAIARREQIDPWISQYSPARPSGGKCRRNHPMSAKATICQICGETPVAPNHLTDGHVFPRCWFDVPKPENLWPISECEKCNKSHAEGDIQVRDFIVGQVDPRNMPEASEQWGKAIRAFPRKQSKVLYGLSQTSFDIDVVNEHGVRVDRTIGGFVAAEPIIKSLEHLGKRLTAHARKCTVGHLRVDAGFVDAQGVQSLLNSMTSMGAQPLRGFRRGDQIAPELTLTFMLDKENRDSGLWLISFYNGQIGVRIITQTQL